MWNNIHPITVFLSITSFLMNFSTTTLINLALDNNSIEGFMLIKALSKVSGYIGKFLVGWISDIFKCNKLILQIGYGSIFLIKPIFYVSMMSFFPSIQFNLYLLVLADCLDQFTNNFRDISRDAMIARTIKNNNLSKNMFFRKASSIAGTMIGAILAFGISFLYPAQHNVIYNNILEAVCSVRSIVLMVAVFFSILGYAFLLKALRYVEEDDQTNSKFTWKNILDLRLCSLISIMLFLVISVVIKLSSFITLVCTGVLFAIYGIVSIMYYLYYKKRQEEQERLESAYIDEPVTLSNTPSILANRMYLFDNRTFVFVGILTMFIYVFQINYFSLIDVFESLMKKDINIQETFFNKPWKQAMAIPYYLISFSASSVLSIINMKKISNLLIIYLLSFICISLCVLSQSLWGFCIAIVFYGIVNGTFEPAINAYVIKHTQKFSYKGITLGIFSIFNSIGIILSITGVNAIKEIMGKIYNISSIVDIIKSITSYDISITHIILEPYSVYDIYKFSLVGNLCIALTIIVLSSFGKDKLKEI